VDPYIPPDLIPFSWLNWLNNFGCHFMHAPFLWFRMIPLSAGHFADTASAMCINHKLHREN
jgi:hypothetical protein